MMESWIKKQRREDRADELFRKDAALPTRQFDGGPDNYADLLHQARYFKKQDAYALFLGQLENPDRIRYYFAVYEFD